MATIVQYLGQVMSVRGGNGQERERVEELWGYVVSERRVEEVVLKVPIEKEGIDQYVFDNPYLVGCHESHLIRKAAS